MLYTAASIPHVPVPEIGIVMSFSVRNTVRSGFCVSSISWMNAGSR